MRSCDMSPRLSSVSPLSPESVRQRSDLFYLQPKHRCTPSSPLWFSSTPLDDATTDAMLTRILAVRELQVKEAR